jgi:hypothetical protein
MNGDTSYSLTTIRAITLFPGIVGLIGCLIGWITAPQEFFRSYLVGWLVWFAVEAVSLLWLMIHFLSGGKWGYPLRRALEAAAGTLPLLALLFIPIFFGLGELYPWTHPAIVAASEVLQKKRAYLNMPGFIIRTAVFFIIWIWIAHLLRKWSHQQDAASTPELMKRLRTLSGPALAFYPFSATFVYIDWIMSLEKDWYSTMFPILICIGQMLGALAFMIILLAWLAPRTSLNKITGQENFHHLGSLLLAFTMMWAYMAFGQLLIIWSGDLPHEISWYLHRIGGGWRWIVVCIFLFHFLSPFFLLLSRKTKRRAGALTIVAAFIFLAHIIDVWWLVTPAFFPNGIHVSWLHFAAITGVGGIWGTVFSMRLRAKSLIPLNDPRFAVAIT